VRVGAVGPPEEGLGGVGGVGAELVLERRDAGLEPGVLLAQLGILLAQRDDHGLERVQPGHQIADRRLRFHRARQRDRHGAPVKTAQPAPDPRRSRHTALDKPQTRERLPGQ
jgi:hypothetical protein